MRRTTPHVDDRELRLLVFGDEDSDELCEAAAHVESCPRCQQRLSSVAAPEPFAGDVRSLLGSYPDLDILPGHRSPQTPPEGDRLDFLAPPSHPEMLGRLGRYEIERVIGSGGMGLVLKAFDTELNRPVAIKVLARHLAHSSAARQRFARESKAAAAVVHEHVVAIHDVQTDGDFPYLVMPYIAGESLQARVERSGPLEARQIMRIAIQAAAGLAAAHEQGVIHRDVKPANILLENGVERALITDFGLARTVDDATLTRTGIVAGTPHYMSPEQANGEATDHRTDLFSLGCVLYFMATGRPPFRGERAMGVLHRICHDTHRPAWQAGGDVPDELSDLIDDLLEKRPSRRPAGAADVKDRLSRMLAGLQHHPARRLGSRRRIGRWLRQHKLAAASLVLLSVVGLFLAAVVAKPRPPAISDVPGSAAKSPAAIESNAQRQALQTEYAALAAEDLVEVEQQQDVARRLERLEALSQASVFVRPDGEFEQQIRSVDGRLERVGEVFIPADIPSK